MQDFPTAVLSKKDTKHSTSSLRPSVRQPAAPWIATQRWSVVVFEEQAALGSGRIIVKPISDPRSPLLLPFPRSRCFILRRRARRRQWGAAGGWLVPRVGLWPAGAWDRGRVIGELSINTKAAKSAKAGRESFAQAALSAGFLSSCPSWPSWSPLLRGFPRTAAKPVLPCPAPP